MPRRASWLPLVFLAFPIVQLFAQAPARGARPAPGPAVNAATDPVLRGFRWRYIGPVGQGGRVDDIAVVENDPRVFYLGYATGGVWKTVNAGVTFEPIFETYGTASIGAVALSQVNPSIVYVGTGEGNGRNSASFGDGVYKSSDAGRTFTHVGLRETQSIQKIVVDPRGPDVVYVAAVGHLYGPNAERGLYKSTNGGTSWSKILYVDENTGASDVVLDPSNPDIVYASMYQRRRTSWGFNGGGPGSGIWKSEDGGAHFKQLTGNGLPGDLKGRIALDIAPSNPNVIYAQIEVLRDEDRVADVGQATRSTRAEMGTDQAGGVWRSADKGATWTFMSNHDVRPQYYSVLRVDPKNDNVVYSVGRRFYRSEDAGKTFRVVNGPGHGDYHAIWINPKNPDQLFVGNDGGSDVTYDRGRTWESFRGMTVGQFAGLSVDMQRPYYVYGGLQDNGNLAGPSAVRGDFISSHDWFNIGGGDGSYTGSDPTGQNYIYSEGQRGVMHRIEMRTGKVVAIQPKAPTDGDPSSNVVPKPAKEEYRWNWATPFVVSRWNSNVIYAGGNRLFKTTDRGDTWAASVDLTRHVNTDTLSIMGVKGSAPYCHGTNAKIARGQQCILSKADGTWYYSTLTTISESPLTRGLLWVGADDGSLQYTRDDGHTWTNVTANVAGAPQNCYVSRVEASHFDASTAYVSLGCQRNDDFRPYVYVTRDLGKTWSSISGDLPSYGNVNVVRQDLKNRNLLFAGTEFGFFVSLDEGKSWKKFMTGLSTVRIDEIIVHPRDADLVLGTHGRSALVMDDITPLQQLGGAPLAMNGVVLAAKPAGSMLDEDVHLFQPRNAVALNKDTRLARSLVGAKQFRGENAPPGTAISYYLKAASSSAVKITITDPAGKLFREITGTGDAGMNRVQWNLQGNLPADGGARRAASDDEDAPRGAPQGPIAKPGTYRVTINVNGKNYSVPAVVERDSWNAEQKP
jgi:photosystem II stability/assembly factor-like uncharacterized protein